MRITIRTIEATSVSVDISEQSTVFDLKASISQTDEIGVKPEYQTLIYAGKILNNEDKLESCDIDENGYIVCLRRKVNAAKAPVTKAATVRKAEGKPEAGGKKPKLDDADAEKAGCSHGAKSTKTFEHKYKLPGGLQPNFKLDQEILKNILRLGYDKNETQRALKASSNNPEMAVQFLVEGMPNTAVAKPNEQHPTTSAGKNAQQPFKESALAFIRDDPQFHLMREFNENHPDQLEVMLRKIGEVNPGLLSLIREHQEEFLALLSEPENDEDAIDAHYSQLSLTERNAIHRLTLLGFERDEVIQAFIACDKNEDHAAEFLFYTHEGDEESGNEED